MKWLRSEEVWELSAGLITIRVYSKDDVWWYKWSIKNTRLIGCGPFPVIADNAEQAKVEAIKGVVSVFKPLVLFMLG